MSELTFKKLVDAIKKTDYKYFGDYEMTEEQRDAVGILVDAAVELMAVSASRPDGWISVEDELPQEDFQVIACCDDDVEACIFRMHDTGNYYFERVDGDFRLEATHWMPLPIPPVKDLK